MKQVEASVHINVSTRRATDAFLLPADLKGWWGVDRSLIETKQGGLYSLAWQLSDAGAKYISTGIIKEYIPAKELWIDKWAYFSPDRPILGPMQLIIRTHEIYSGTNLTVIQSGYQEGEHWQWYYEAVYNAWPQVLVQLKAYLENKYLSNWTCT
jgi:hypothetical protein